MAKLTKCVRPGSWYLVSSHLSRDLNLCVFDMYVKSPLPPPLFLNLFLFLKMSFLQTQTPTLVLALPLGRSHGSCPPCLLSSSLSRLVPTYPRVLPRQSKLLVTNHAVRLLLPQPRDHEHKFWGQEDVGLNSGFTRIPELWAGDLTSLGLRLPVKQDLLHRCVQCLLEFGAL